MKITSTSNDEEIVKFFIWDGQSAEEAVDFVKKHIRPEMLPPTDTLIKTYKSYEMSFNQ